MLLDSVEPCVSMPNYYIVYGCILWYTICLVSFFSLVYCFRSSLMLNYVTKMLTNKTSVMKNYCN